MILQKNMCKTGKSSINPNPVGLGVQPTQLKPLKCEHVTSEA